MRSLWIIADALPRLLQLLQVERANSGVFATTATSHAAVTSGGLFTGAKIAIDVVVPLTFVSITFLAWVVSRDRR